MELLYTSILYTYQRIITSFLKKKKEEEGKKKKHKKSLPQMFKKFCKIVQSDNVPKAKTLPSLSSFPCATQHKSVLSLLAIRTRLQITVQQKTTSAVESTTQQCCRNLF
jgi:hypothetical protein